MAHIVPGIFESAEWQAWIELQRAPRLNSFLRFLNALPDPAILSPKMSRQVFEKILRESYNEVLLDDLEVLREFCAARGTKNFSRPPKRCERCRFSRRAPRSRSFSNKRRPALAHLGWKQHALEIASVRTIGRRVSMRSFRARFFCAGWRKLR